MHDTIIEGRTVGVPADELSRLAERTFMLAADRRLSPRARRVLADRREVRRTYRELSDELADKTDGIVKVSHEAIRRWCLAFGIEDDRNAA